MWLLIVIVVLMCAAAITCVVGACGAYSNKNNTAGAVLLFAGVCAIGMLGYTTIVKKGPLKGVDSLPTFKPLVIEAVVPHGEYHHVLLRELEPSGSEPLHYRLEFWPEADIGECLIVLKDGARTGVHAVRCPEKK